MNAERIQPLHINYLPPISTLFSNNSNHQDGNKNHKSPMLQIQQNNVINYQHVGNLSPNSQCSSMLGQSTQSPYTQPEISEESNAPIVSQRNLDSNNNIPQNSTKRKNSIATLLNGCDEHTDRANQCLMPPSNRNVQAHANPTPFDSPHPSAIAPQHPAAPSPAPHSKPPSRADPQNHPQQGALPQPALPFPAPHPGTPSLINHNNFLAIGKTISKSKTNVRITNGILTITRRTRFTTYMDICNTPDQPAAPSPSALDQVRNSNVSHLLASSNADGAPNRAQDEHSGMSAMNGESFNAQLNNIIHNITNDLNQSNAALVRDHHSRSNHGSNSSSSVIIPFSKGRYDSPNDQANNNGLVNYQYNHERHANDAEDDDDDEDEDQLFQNQSNHHLNMLNSKRYKVVTVLEQVHRVPLV